MNKEGTKKKRILYIIGTILVLLGFGIFFFGVKPDFPVWLFYLCCLMCIIGILIIILGFVMKESNETKIEKVISSSKDNSEPIPIPKNNIDTENIASKTLSSNSKTIRYDDLHGFEQEMSFEIIEDNKGILKLSDDYSLIDLYHGSSLPKSPDKAYLSADYVIGSYDSCINRNHLCILGREGEGGNFYIDINNLAKVKVMVYAGPYNYLSEDDFNSDDDFDHYEKHTIILETKNGAIFDDLEYEISYSDDIRKFVNLIKKINNSVTVDYQYTIYMTSPKYHSVKYGFNEKLHIETYSLLSNTIEISLSTVPDLEISINYSDISNSDIVNTDDNRLSVNIFANNTHYFLIFADTTEATNFYNELKKHK